MDVNPKNAQKIRRKTLKSMRVTLRYPKALIPIFLEMELLKGQKKLEVYLRLSIPNVFTERSSLTKIATFKEGFTNSNYFIEM